MNGNSLIYCTIEGHQVESQKYKTMPNNVCLFSMNHTLCGCPVSYLFLTYVYQVLALLCWDLK